MKRERVAEALQVCCVGKMRNPDLATEVLMGDARVESGPVLHPLQVGRW